MKRSPEYYRNAALALALLGTFDLAQAIFLSTPYRIFACGTVLFYGAALYYYLKWREAEQEENGKQR